MLSIALSSLAQGPGDGVAKTTYTSSQPFVGLAFLQKYLPTTAAIDKASSLALGFSHSLCRRHSPARRTSFQVLDIFSFEYMLQI